MWRLEKAVVKVRGGAEVVCIPAPRAPAIVRSGRGWGRKGSDSYYLYTPPGTVSRLAKKPVRRLGGMDWITCLEDKTGRRWCFEWRDGKIAPARMPLSP